MKKYLLWLTLLILYACNGGKYDNQSDTLSAKSDKGKAARLIKDSITKAEKDTIPAYTSDVYKIYIPDSVLRIIEKKLPGWKLPAPDSWEKFWFHEYKKDGVLVNYISADFNDDSIRDYALILINNKKEFSVWVLQSKSNDFEAINLLQIGKSNLQIDIGITIIPKGKLNYIDFDSDKEPKPIDLKSPAIQVTAFEQSAETYFWKNGKYLSVTTGD